MPMLDRLLRGLRRIGIAPRRVPAPPTRGADAADRVRIAFERDCG